ncbi:hypothetical protein [Dyadobacter sp. CY312]|uniref:hypothetical protein n=1 Tax=Dyadobacter sp. CY312 TaxID=2907303 RepID=UPI001F355FBB|nr:hypothetical protein [Dyadobacter sp. CY312]MCE7043812.1 hypothetical protein [Dyadobacter sp. CY312]
MVQPKSSLVLLQNAGYPTQLSVVKVACDQTWRNYDTIRFYLADGFEKDVTAGSTRYIQYIASPTGLAAIVESVRWYTYCSLHLY